MAHSPLPWSSRREWSLITLREYGMETLRDADGNFVSHSENAEFIVRCVNSHAALLSALKDVLAQFDSGTFVRNTDSDGCSDWAIRAIAPLRALADAKAAIALAEATHG